MFERAIPIEDLNLQAITPFAIELHDIIITKLGRYHAKDRADIELLTRIPRLWEGWIDGWVGQLQCTGDPS